MASKHQRQRTETVIFLELRWILGWSSDSLGDRSTLSFGGSPLSLSSLLTILSGSLYRCISAFLSDLSYSVGGEAYYVLQSASLNQDHEQTYTTCFALLVLGDRRNTRSYAASENPIFEKVRSEWFHVLHSTVIPDLRLIWSGIYMGQLAANHLLVSAVRGVWETKKRALWGKEGRPPDGGDVLRLSECESVDGWNVNRPSGYPQSA